MLVARIAGPSSSSQPTPKPIVLRLAPHLAPLRPLVWHCGLILSSFSLEVGLVRSCTKE